MTIDEADEQGIISKEEYNKVINHIEEVNKTINKYDYIAKHVCKIWEDRQEDK